MLARSECSEGSPAAPASHPDWCSPSRAGAKGVLGLPVAPLAWLLCSGFSAWQAPAPGR